MNEFTCDEHNEDFQNWKLTAHTRIIEHFSRALPAIADQLRSLHVCEVWLRYDGYLTHGAITPPRFFASNRRSLDSLIDAETMDDLRVHLAGMLQLHDLLWKDAAGSLGDFLWSLRTDELRHTHVVRSAIDEFAGAAAVSAVAPSH